MEVQSVEWRLFAASTAISRYKFGVCVWAGQPEALNRLILGYSQFLPATLLKCGTSDDQLPIVMAELSSSLGTPLAADPMPTGDAIALADFLVDVTKRYVHFLRGADTVGGDTILPP